MLKKIHYITIYIFFIFPAVHLKSQSNPISRPVIFSEKFNSGFSVGDFPAGNNSIISAEGGTGSYQNTLDLASGFNTYSDLKIQDIIHAPDGIQTSTISGGNGPYGYIDDTGNPSLMISLSDKIFSLGFSINSLTGSNVRFSYTLQLIEKTTAVNAFFFLQYRISESGAWSTVSGTTYATSDWNTGDITTISGFLPGCPIVNSDFVEFRLVTWQDGPISTGSGELLSFSIDNILIENYLSQPVPDNAVVSFCGTRSLNFNIVNPSAELQYKWYDASQAVLSINSVNFDSPEISNSDIYLVESNDGTCASALTTIQAVFASINTPSLINNHLTICGTGNISFGIQSPTSDLTYHWYNSSTGGTSITNGSFLDVAITKDTLIWVNATRGAYCASNLASAIGIVLTIPSTPAISNSTQSACGQGKFTFIISNTLPGLNYRWFDATSNLLDITTQFQTTTLTGSENYFVDAFNSICASAKIPATATINPVPALPVIDNSIKSFCGTGTITFNASNADSYTYYWYNTSVSGSNLTINPSFTTPSFYNNMIHAWVEASSGLCISERVMVTAISGRIPLTPAIDNITKTICGSNTLSFSITNNTEPQYRWFDAFSGGNLVSQQITFSTPESYNTTRNYWAESYTGLCSSERVAITGVFYRIPDLPIPDNSNKFICGSGTITFNISNNTESVYNWYDASSGGNLNHTDDSFTTPTFYNNTVNAWVEASTGICISNRVMVTAVSGRIPVTPIIDNTAKTICGNNTLSFSITNNTEPQYRWFDASSNGNIKSDQINFTTPESYNTILNYWVESYTGDCSSQRVPVTAIFYRVPDLPLLDNAVKSICGIGTISFNITNNTEPGYNWYDASSEGNLLEKASIFTTPSTYNDTLNYWVEASTDQCKSARTQASGYFYSIPSLPIVFNPGDSLCGHGTISFTLTAPDNSLQYLWYDSDSLVLNNDKYTTPFLREPHFYKVQSFNGQCVSQLVDVYAKIKQVPDPLITFNNETLIATDKAEFYRWAIAIPSNAIATATTNQLKINYSGIYFVTLAGFNGCITISYYEYLKAGGDTIYYEGFQEGMPVNFTIIKADNAVVEKTSNYFEIYEANPWSVIPATNKLGSTFFGGINNKVASATSIFSDKNINADRWMISDTITLNHEGLSYTDLIENTTFGLQWKAVSDDGGDYPDAYKVLISSTTKDIASFTPVFSIAKEEITPIKRLVDPLSKDLNGKKIFVAFQLTTPKDKGNRLLIDDLMIIGTTVKLTDPNIPLSIDKLQEKMSLFLYPNPGESLVKLTYTIIDATPVVIHLFDITGRELINKKIENNLPGENIFELDISGFSSGTYFVNVQSNKENKTIRLFVK